MKNREAQIIRTHRIELCLTQHAVAIKLGMHIRQYQRFEYGEQSLTTRSMKTELMICAVLQLDPFDFVLPNDNESLW